MAVRLYLYDDARARGWEPFVLSRPVGELLFGCMPLRKRSELAWDVRCAGHVADPDLEGFTEEEAPPVVGLSSVLPADTRILVSSRVVFSGAPLPRPDRARTLLVDGAVAGYLLPAGTPTPAPSALAPDAAPLPGTEATELAGVVLAEPWDLVSKNGRRVEADLELLGYPALDPPNGVHVEGNAGVFARSDARVEPGVVLDTREGPVILEAASRIQGPARIAGPLFLGRGSIVLGGVVGNTSIGPACKIRGEVVDSVVTGFSNKAHDGYLGHALLGRWVNLGAMTTNSDLKNTYGTVRVERSDGSVETGLLKVGCFIGDHVLTGIGTLINTGAVIGAASTLLGGGVFPKHVPPFSWGEAAGLREHRIEKFLETADRMMRRRDRVLEPGMTRLWRRAFEQTQPLRDRRGGL